MTTPDDYRLPSEPELRQAKLEMIWEVLYRVKADPARAIWFFAEHHRLVYTQQQAVDELAAAKTRNSLKIVDSGALRSRFGQRLRCR